MEMLFKKKTIIDGRSQQINPKPQLTGKLGKPCLKIMLQCIYAHTLHTLGFIVWMKNSVGSDQLASLEPAVLALHCF